MILNLKQPSKGDFLFLGVGELLIALLTVGGFFLFDKYDFRVLVGALIGAVVIVINYAMLTVAVNRAVDRVMAERGEGEMTEEEASAFAAAHTAEVQKSVKASYLVRQLILLVLLVVPLLFKIANVLAVAIPLLMFRPIVMAREAICGKKTKKR